MLRVLGRSARSLLSAAQQQQAVPAVQRRLYGSHHDDHDDHEHHGYDQTPTVFDNLLTLNVVDLAGKRHTIRGLAGQKLNEVLVEAGFPETYFFPNMGFYTQHIVDAHVFIPQDFWSNIPNFKEGSEEAFAIKRTFRDIIQDYAKETSYLASYVTLTPEMNNMTVGIGPIKPWCLHTHWAFNGVHDSTKTQFSKPTVDIWG